MIDPNKDVLPGVIFRVQETQIMGTVSGKKKRVKVTLEAEINDDEVWASVRPRLDGLKVYTVDDFKTELLNALRVENAELEKNNKRLESLLRETLDENRHMKAALSVLETQLTR